MFPHIPSLMLSHWKKYLGFPSTPGPLPAKEVWRSLQKEPAGVFAPVSGWAWVPGCGVGGGSCGVGSGFGLDSGATGSACAVSLFGASFSFGSGAAGSGVFTSGASAFGVSIFMMGCTLACGGGDTSALTGAATDALPPLAPLPSWESGHFLTAIRLELRAFHLGNQETLS